MTKNYPKLINQEFCVKLYVIISAILFFVILLIFLLISQNNLQRYKSEEQVFSDKIADLEKKYNLAQKKIDRLKMKTAEIERVLQAIPSPSELKAKGINNQIDYIKKDLKMRNDLIPYDGVFGGTMGFYDEKGIHILNHKWVYAHFDDGHINGEILLKYNVSGDGKIHWTVIDSFK